LKGAENWEEEYQLASSAAQVSEMVEGDAEADEPVQAAKASIVEEDPDAAKIRMDKLLGRRPDRTKGVTPPAKKS
jgi:hypothetical protein